MNTAESFIMIRGVSRFFGKVRAVDNLNFDIRAGEFFSLLGPSGCGKTTLLRLLAGFEMPDAGEIFIDGQPQSRLPANRRPTNMVFQSYAIFPHLDVKQNIAYGLRNQGLSKAHIAVAVSEALELIKLPGYGDRRANQLSGGQRQRVALGRAIVRQPQVFLFDEPLSNLDAKLRVQMRVELKKLHNRLNTTAVYVTHDQVEAMTLGDRVVVMKDGLVQQVGEPLELYNAPANRFVAGFIGSPAMNFAGVRVRDANGGLKADNAGFDIDIPAEIGSRLRPYAGRDVTIGIRPEDLQIANGSHPPGLCFDAMVEVVERLGPEILLDLQVGEQNMVAAVEPTVRAKRGDKIRFALRPERLHFFDTASEAAI
jgi:multiple sugar transport system ATP-binding protein